MIVQGADVGAKAAQLVQTWGREFESVKDALPGFTETYRSLQAKGVAFPDTSAQDTIFTPPPRCVGVCDGQGCFAVCRRGAVAMAVHCSAKSSAWHSHPAALVALPTAPSHVPPRPPRTAARPKSCSLDRALTAVSHRRCHRRRRQACRPADDPRQEAPSFTQRWQRPQHPPQQRPRHRLLLLRVRCPQPC